MTPRAATTKSATPGVAGRGLAAERVRFLCFRLFVPLAIVDVFVTGYWVVARPGLS